MTAAADADPGYFCAAICLSTSFWIWSSRLFFRRRTSSQPMTSGHKIVAMAPMTTAVMYWLRGVGYHEDEPCDGRADDAADDVLEHRTLLPDHLAEEGIRSRGR